jgi:simple sugar transport system permease protein
VIGFAAPLLALVFALLVGAVALALVGESPAHAYKVMWEFGTRRDSLLVSINRAVPLYISGLAVAIGFKMGLFNIGVDGQYRLAAVLAAAAGGAIVLPGPLHLLFVLAVAMTVGAGWAGIAGVLKTTRGVSEVISTIMLNFVGTGLSAYLVATRFRVKSEAVPQTKTLAKSAWVQPIDKLLGAIGIDVPPAVDVYGFVVIAALLGVAFYVVVWRTRFGFDLRASGFNPSAATASGVDAKAMVIKTMLISGAIAGLVGMPQLLGFFHRYTQDFPSGLGFAGIAIALLGRNHPGGIAVAAYLFGWLDRASQQLTFEEIPREIIGIMQGALVLSIVVAYEVVRRLGEQQLQRSLARGDAPPAGPSAPPAEVPA